MVQWCGCSIICEQCMRNTVLETGCIRCIHCRKVKPATSRMTYLFLKDVFARKSTYSFHRQVLNDMAFARKLYDFMVAENMDTRLLVELLPRATTDLALHVIGNDPKRFCVFRHDIRNDPAVALLAVRLYNPNIEYVDQPLTMALLETVAVTSGLVNVPEDERPRLAHKFDEILARKGNVDIFRIEEPTRAQWLIAARATPILASRVPGADLTTADGVLAMADACRDVGFYRYLSEELREDRLLAHALLQKQLAVFHSDFNFLDHILFKPSRTFTVGCMRSCPRSIQTAAEYDEATALFCMRSDGLLLRHSLITTLDVCRAAVTQNGAALAFCPPHIARRLQVLAVTVTKAAIQYAPDKHSYAMMELAMPEYLLLEGAAKIPEILLRDHVARDPILLRHVEYKYQTPELVEVGDKKYANPALVTGNNTGNTGNTGSKMDRFISENGIDVLSISAPSVP